MNESVIPPTVPVVYACKKVVNSWYDRLDGENYDQIISTAETNNRHEILCINSNGLIDVMSDFDTLQAMNVEEKIRMGERKCRCGSEMTRVNYHPKQNVFPKVDDDIRTRVRAMVDVAQQAAGSAPTESPRALAHVPTPILRHAAQCLARDKNDVVVMGDNSWHLDARVSLIGAWCHIRHYQDAQLHSEVVATRVELEGELQARDVTDHVEKAVTLERHSMNLADIPEFVLRCVAKCFLEGTTITLGSGSLEAWHISASPGLVDIHLTSHGQIYYATMTRSDLEAELNVRGMASCIEKEPDRAVHVMRVDDLPSFVLTQVAACFRTGASRMTIGNGTLDEWRIERYANFVTINRLCHGALYGAVVTRVDLDLELHARGLPTTGGTMDKDSIVDTLKTDAADAAWRTAGSQLVKLARDPLAALLSRHLAPDDDALRGRVAAFLQTDIGTAVLSGLLAVAVGAVPGDASVADRLARELRVRSLASGSDLLAEVVMGPLRQVMSLYLQGVPEVAAAAAAVAPAIEPPAPTARATDGSGIKVKVAK